jgi:hypothetical protein
LHNGLGSKTNVLVKRLPRLRLRRAARDLLPSDAATGLKLAGVVGAFRVFSLRFELTFRCGLKRDATSLRTSFLDPIRDSSDSIALLLGAVVDELVTLVTFGIEEVDVVVVD